MKTQAKYRSAGIRGGTVLIFLVTFLLPWTSVMAVNPDSPGCGAIIQDLPGYLSGTGVALDAAPDRPFIVTRQIPHDSEAFTQGLVFYSGYLYESTGLQGHSSVRKIDLTSGRVVAMKPVRATLFGEGLTELNDRFLQLTWHSETALSYDADLNLNDSVKYEGDAWGLTTNMKGRLIVSDGSSTLKFLDAETFRLINTLKVNDHGRQVGGLNELEYIDKWIYANVFPTDCIAEIDPVSGTITSWINLYGLLPWSQRKGHSAVANGIAYDANSGKLFVTGKYWPFIFWLKLMETKEKSNSERFFSKPLVHGQLKSFDKPTIHAVFPLTMPKSRHENF